MTSLARTSDPIESHLAAASLDHIKLSRVEQAILKILVTPMTDEELVEAYEASMRLGAIQPSSPSGIRTRRNHLWMKQLVRVIGVTKSKSGRQARIWIAND
jgi:hypothetical protein